MQALTREELTRFLTACKQASETDWLMALMAVNHGLRVSELCGRWATKRVKKQKVRYFHPGILGREVRDGYVTIRRLKGSEATTQPLVAHDNPLFDERSAVEILALKTRPDEPLFKMERTTAWRHLQRHGRAAGIRLAGAHIRGMKHTLGTLAAEKTPVKKLQLQMGHKNPKSTMAYYDVTADEAAETVQKALGL
jgi:integrase